MIKEVHIKEKKNSIIYRKIIDFETNKTTLISDIYFSEGKFIILFEFKERKDMENKISEINKSLEKEILEYKISAISDEDDEVISFDLKIKLTNSLYINAT
jgi:hypothetical protein